MSALASLISPARGVRVGPIGLEFAEEELHMVQLERSVAGAIRLRAKVLQPYNVPFEEFMSEPRLIRTVVQKALKADRFKGRRVVTVMPRGATRILPLTYQVRKGEDEEEVLAGLMEPRLEGDLDEYVIDYVPIRGNQKEGDRVALVAVIPRREVVQFLDLLTAAGLEAAAIEIGPTAIKRLVSKLAEHDPTGNILVVNFGARKSYLTIISGRRLMFDTEFDIGELTLVEQLAAALESTPDQARLMIRRHGLVPTLGGPGSEEAAVSETVIEILKPRLLEIVDEVSRALVYAASETRGLPVRHVYMLGSIARWHGADEIFSDLLELPVGIVPDPLVSFQGSAADARKPRNIGQTPPEMAVATGLALRELEDA